MNEPTKHERNLFRVMVIGTSLSFGILAALIVSMKDFFHGNATLEFSYKSVLAFVLGCTGGWLFWYVVRHWTRKVP